MDKVPEKEENLGREPVQIRAFIGAVIHLDQPLIDHGFQIRHNDFGRLHRPRQRA